MNKNDIIMKIKHQKQCITDVRFEDGLLFINCRTCQGSSSLSDAGCVKCISKKMEEKGDPARLMLRKESDTEYSEDAVEVLKEISKISSMTSAAAMEKVPARCRNCRTALPKNAADIWDSFPEPAFETIRSEAERSSPNKEGCEECLWRTIGFVDRLETMFFDLKKKAAKKAFRLTEV